MELVNLMIGLFCGLMNMHIILVAEKNGANMGYISSKKACIYGTSAISISVLVMYGLITMLWWITPSIICGTFIITKLIINKSNWPYFYHFACLPATVSILAALFALYLFCINFSNYL
jgi:hypothetical protein